MKPSSDIDLFTTTLPFPVLVSLNLFLRRTLGCSRGRHWQQRGRRVAEAGTPRWKLVYTDHGGARFAHDTRRHCRPRSAPDLVGLRRPRATDSRASWAGRKG